MTVQAILNSRTDDAPAYVAPDATIATVLDVLAANKVGALIVSSDGIKLEGIVSERDVVRGLQSDGASLLNQPVSQIMTQKVITCAPGDPAAGITATMISKHLRHMPVLSEGRFVSMLSIRDLLQLRLDEVRAEAEAMRSYIAGDMSIGN